MLSKIVLFLHIIFGTIGLLSGTLIILRKKGDKLHKNIGKYFTIAMIFTGVCALYLASIKNNQFLFAVGIFTIYLSISGFRILQLKRDYLVKKPKFIDVFLTFTMFICSLFFFLIAYKCLIQKEVFGLLFLSFGLISLRLCYSELKMHRQKINDKKYWIKNHIGRMTGSYIAALTAFLVINNTFLPPILAWCLPGIIGGIFINNSIKKLNQNS